MHALLGNLALPLQTESVHMAEMEQQADARSSGHQEAANGQLRSSRLLKVSEIACKLVAPEEWLEELVPLAHPLAFL